MGLDFEEFEKVNYKFPGIYRGLVENNADPEDVGRLQVRIFGIHNFDGEITPVEQLPWAEPALGLAWSGGYNIKNQDYPHSEPVQNTVKNGRYNVGNRSKVMGSDHTVDSFPNKSNNNFQQIRQDPTSNACGTGGDFVVPKRGNWVFLFFEAGNHDKPIYFAMAPMARDWHTQKSWRNTEVNLKVEQINEFKKEFTPRNQSKATGDSWASEAVVNTLVNKPDLAFFPSNEENGPDTSNRDIQCITSANGTTIVIDQRLGREQIYVIHKNYMEYTDPYGNRKIYVGKKRGKDFGPTSTDTEDPCHYEMGVEGNHELHVFGNYDLYAKGRMHIQCDSHVQIDAKESVGVVCREGDVDVIVENGNMNADIAGNLDVDAKKNANIKVNSNANIQVKGDLKASVFGSSDLKLDGKVTLTTNDDLDIKAENIKIEANKNVDITAEELRVSDKVSIGKDVKIGGMLDVAKKTSIASQLFVDIGISCGGYIRNMGPADLGSPVTAHTLIVTTGPGSGFGIGSRTPDSPDSPTDAIMAQREPGITVRKTFNGLQNGNPSPITKASENPGSSI